MHPSAPEWDFAIFQKNGVNMKPVGVNRCYNVAQWTRITSILPMGTPPCKEEHLASTYRHHHFTLYSLQKRLGRDGEGPESGRSPRPAAAVWEQFEDILELLGASGPARE